MPEQPEVVPPSEEFIRAVHMGSALVAYCECGRVYFSSSGDYDAGELADLRAKAEGDTKYTEVGDDFTPTGDIAGCTYAVDCPCHGLRKYEDFIWSHRHLILSYLCAMTKAHMADAVLEMQTLTGKAVQMLRQENTLLRNDRALSRRVAHAAGVAVGKAEYDQKPGRDVYRIPGRDLRRIKHAMGGRVMEGS